MRNRKGSTRMAILSLLTVLLLFFPLQVLSQDYPTKPITIYVGYEPGATVDLSTRAMAKGAEKILGVPVVVEDKPGGGASVCAALVASKPPDGYTFGSIEAGVLTARPHLISMAFDPLKDFSFILQYAEGRAGLCVLSESPLKTIDDFIKYAKEHPGLLSYSSSGVWGRGHVAMEALNQCKGLTLKHVPYTGGAPANTALLGKHVDCVAGSGTHLQYLRQGAFRMLLVFSAEKRDPLFPDIPILKELGCDDTPPGVNLIVGPKGVPDAISKKVAEACRKAIDTPEFKKTLDSLYMLYSYKDGAEVKKAMEYQYEWYKSFLAKIGAKKAG